MAGISEFNASFEAVEDVGCPSVNRYCSLVPYR